MPFTLRILALCTLLGVVTHAQVAIVQSVDLHRFPSMRARIFAFDSLAHPVSLHPTRDRLVYDSPTRQTIGVISCESTAPSQNISAVLVFDGSMPELFPVYRDAMQWWNERVDSTSQTALVEYGSRPYLVRDLVNKPDTLLKSIETFQPLTASNLERALNDSLCGAFAILSRATARRVAILICTAHHPLSSRTIDSLAAAHDVQISAICVGISADTALRGIVVRSGGVVVDNCPNTGIPTALKALGTIATGTTACMIDWNSDSTACSIQRQARFDIKSLGVFASWAYTIPDSMRAHLSASPLIVDFGDVASGNSADTVIVLTANGRTIAVQAVEIDNPEFELTQPLGGLHLGKGKQFALHLRFNSSDDFQRYAIARIINDACDTITCYLLANHQPNPAFSPLFDSFNNGEKVYAGSRQIIRWIGTPPTDSVHVEFSADGGGHWIVIADTVTGLQTSWKVPDISSQRCFLRIAQIHQDLYHYSNSFSIIQPTIKPGILSCGTIRLSEEFVVPSATILCNPLSVPLSIDSLSGEDSQFIPVSGWPVQLSAGACARIAVLCTPAQTGLLRDTISAYTNQGLLRIPITALVKPAYATVPDYVMIGRIPIGQNFDTLVNSALCKANANVVHVLDAVQDFPDIAHFSMPEQVKNQTLTTEDPCKGLRFQFNCTQIQRFSSRVRVVSDSGTYEFVLFGEGICAPPEPHYGIEIPDSITVAIGSTVDVPIRYYPAPYTYRKMKRPYTMEVRFDKSILFPTGDTPLGVVEGDQRVLKISSTGFEDGDTLVLLHFKSAMGLSDRTFLSIGGFNWLDECQYHPVLSGGRVFLSNVCRAGGLREYVSGDTLKFNLVEPNPSHEQVDLHFTAREIGAHQLTLYDMFGRVVREVFRQDLDIGHYESVIDVHDLISGDYYAVLNTPTGKITAVIGVVH